MTKEEIKKILGCAIMAPSGENCQPWKFVVKENAINVFNVPERDQSLYNWEQRASFIANGAAIENIVIAAKEEGYVSNLKLFPENGNQNHVANIELTKEAVSKDDLYPCIFERCTNRKYYDNIPLKEEHITEFVNSIPVNNECKFLFTQEQQKKEALGKAGAVNEAVMFSNQELHNFFFSHVNWTKEEDDKKKMGFYVHALELQPADIAAFKIFQRWKLTNMLNKLIGFNKILGKKQGKFYSSASGFGIITIDNKSPESFVQTGRALQRLWLTVTKLNLSLHPLTGALFFKLQIDAGESNKFSSEQINMINTGYEAMTNAFDLKRNEIVSFMFRIGYGGKPTARSSRFALEEVSEIVG